MKKVRKFLIVGILVLISVIVGMIIWIKVAAPPVEEWISYENDKVIVSIDSQLDKIDIEKLVTDKEHFILNKNVEQLQQAVLSGKLTYEELTAIYLYRIKTLDQNYHGYNSVVEVSPDAIEQARDKDRTRMERLNAGLEQPPYPLFGIPVMFKDNINTAGIPTSVGTVAFADFVPNEDAKLVRTLREQGAIILGKNNLSEFANYVSSIMPGGYSGRKGQTVNPYGPLKISPSGSSSGSAVAVTANLVPISIGTETAGSIIGPAAANSVVGFKPSRNSVSNEGIFPLIQEVDTPGPIAKSVIDAAIAYSALSGQALPQELSGASLKNTTIGIVAYEYNDTSTVKKLKSLLEAAGAKVVDVELDETDIQVQNIISFTFRRDFEEFTQHYGLPITKLEDLISFNKEDPKRRIKYGQDNLESAASETTDSSLIEASILTARKKLSAILNDRGLDTIVFLNTTASSAISAAGYPELTIPFEINKNGVPTGATFAAGFGEDWKLLNLGLSFEQVFLDNGIKKLS